MDYENEQKILLQLLEDVHTDQEIIDSDEESDSEENVVTEEVLESETEQEADSSDSEVNGSPQKRLRIPFFLGKDCTTKWYKYTTPKRKTRSKNILKVAPGVTEYSKNAKTILECWRLFFDNLMLDLVVEETNNYIRSRAANYSRERDCRFTDKTEIEALLGLLYLGGLLKSAKLNVDDLWDRNGIGIERFWLTMSKKRFLFLLRCLRFDDLTTRPERKSADRLAPIRQLFESFVSNCKHSYVVGDAVTIDEKLEGFWGRCIFRQYIPNKPNKYGIKIFALVDARNRYILNLEVYVGLQPEGPFCVANDPASIVKRMVQPITGTNRNVTADNWFTSFPLVEDLLKNFKLTYVGTVRKNKRELPPEFVNIKNRPRYSSVFGFGENSTIVSYVPKKNKNVILASSMHDDDTIDQQSGDKTKPEIITYYNEKKGGVDTVDKLCATYDVARNTKRWPMVVFYAMMNMAGINAQIVHFNSNQDNKIGRRSLLKLLAAELTSPHIARQSEQSNVPVEVRERRQEAAEPSRVHFQEIAEGTRKKCHYCLLNEKNRKTKYYCKMCKKFLCLQHVTPLCQNCSNV